MTEEEQAFRELVDVEYWAFTHEDHEQSDAENEAAAFAYVDPITGECDCCAVDYRNVATRPRLAAFAVSYPNDVTVRSLQRRPPLEGSNE